MDKYKTMGEEMEEGQSEGWSDIAMWGGYLLYLGGVAYVAVHNFNLFTNTNILPENLRVWGYVTAAILAVNALILPPLIHTRFMPGGQKEWAMLVYVLDILAAIGNAVVDSIFNRGGTLEGIEGFYFQYMVVATPIFFGIIAWAVIWLLDPAQKMRDTKVRAKAAALKTLQRRIIEEAKHDAAVDSDLTNAAQEINRAITREVVGAQRRGLKIPVALSPSSIPPTAADRFDDDADLPTQNTSSDVGNIGAWLTEHGLALQNLVELAKARVGGNGANANAVPPTGGDTAQGK